MIILSFNFKEPHIKKRWLLFLEAIKKLPKPPDIICLQEVPKDQKSFPIPGYHKDPCNQCIYFNDNLDPEKLRNFTIQNVHFPSTAGKQHKRQLEFIRTMKNCPRSSYNVIIGDTNLREDDFNGEITKRAAAFDDCWIAAGSPPESARTYDVIGNKYYPLWQYSKDTPLDPAYICRFDRAYISKNLRCTHFQLCLDESYPELVSKMCPSGRLSDHSGILIEVERMEPCRIVKTSMIS